MADRPTYRGDMSEECAIFELSFDAVFRYRPFEVVAPRFVAARADQVDAPGLHRSDRSPVAPYAAVELSVAGADASGETVVAGLADRTGQHVLALYDGARGRVGIELRRSGRRELVRRRSVRLPGAFRFAFVLCENQVTVLVGTAEGWRPVLTERDKVARRFDLRDPDTLRGFTYAWGSRRGTGSTSAATAEIGGVRAGLFGMAGLRDLHLVQHSDGRPYRQHGKLYFTGTCAGMGFFRQAHWGVFTLDPDKPERLDQVGQLFSARDGLVLGDHAGQIVRDDENQRWIVATSSWGDFDFAGVHVRHATTTEDVLHGVHVLETERTPLPTTAGCWDPAMAKIDGAWHVAFVESPSQKPFDFHPALAVAEPGSDWCRGLRLVGAATDLHQCEGPILTRLDGRWWLLASDGDARHYPVFTTGLRQVGRLDAPYPTNIPHPQVVPLEDGRHLMVTFDGTEFGRRVLGYGGHGDVVVMRSRPRR